MSPDPQGTFLYVGTNSGHAAVLVFSRDPSTGQLTQLPGVKGCITSTGTAPGPVTCGTANALDGAYEEALSPDGANLCVIAFSANAIVVLRRQPDGSLAQLSGTPGCVSADGRGKLFVTLKFTSEARRVLSSLRPDRLGATFDAVATDRAGNRAGNRCT